MAVGLSVVTSVHVPAVHECESAICFDVLGVSNSCRGLDPGTIVKR